MRAVLRALDASRHRDRIGALKAEVDAHPDGHGKLLLAVALWEDGNLIDAFRLAEPLLEESPELFDLLVICLSYHLEYGDDSQVDAYARRLAVAKNPAGFLRVSTTVMNVLTFPLRLFGYRRGSHKIADALDAWARWAREYVMSHPSMDTGA